MHRSPAICVFLSLLLAGSAVASEYGRSTYSPGLVGDFSMAVLPDTPGFYLRASYLVNAENPATHYRTGNELAIAAIAAIAVWRLDARWSLGVAGYAYQQLTGDTGDGAIFGDFKGQAWGAGPLLRYIGTVGERRIAWQAKWIHDFETTRRYQGDLLVLSASLRW